jgi:hypothetical protein
MDAKTLEDRCRPTQCEVMLVGSAFEDLFQTALPHLRRSVAYIARDGWEADDVVQVTTPQTWSRHWTGVNTPIPIRSDNRTPKGPPIFRTTNPLGFLSRKRGHTCQRTVGRSLLSTRMKPRN